MSACNFCAILNGTAPASFVYRDERVSAFMDQQPVNPGHLLVVPNRHAGSLAELDPVDGARMFQVAQRLAAAVRRSGLPCAGANLYLADGAAAGQEVLHIHLHVIPRLSGDGAGMRKGSTSRPFPPQAALDTAAAAIRRALDPGTLYER
jgi:histidine triad (HIT) family protein